ncbi:MAG: ABC transporter substrate-binding protein [Dehalococcoidia bacterium]|nr:ABC transporter substrate-binding protein [Dehalococcoidia bacterium]
MNKLLALLTMVGLLLFMTIGGCTEKEEAPIGMAVEFTDHAACAYISQDKGWFEEEGLKLTAYENYATGMALAAALARGDIQVAYICLVPAINAYANAGVPIMVVAGTHKYGYGLVVNPEKIKTVEDLEKPDIRIGCVQVGGAVDVVLRKTIDKYGLDEDKVLNHVQRMNPPKQVLAIETGQLDAAFLPEHWATMAEELGFKMLLTSQDVWPGMQGSVLVVKDDLINSHPEVVRKLVEVSKRASEWANQHPQEAAEVMARQLQAAGGEVFPAEVAEVAAKLEITPEVLLRSMGRLEYTTDIDPEVVQETIDYLVELGYIKTSFSAEDILDLRYLK